MKCAIYRTYMGYCGIISCLVPTKKQKSGLFSLFSLFLLFFSWQHRVPPSQCEEPKLEAASSPSGLEERGGRNKHCNFFPIDPLLTPPPPPRSRRVREGGDAEAKHAHTHPDPSPRLKSHTRIPDDDPTCVWKERTRADFVQRPAERDAFLKLRNSIRSWIPPY